MENQLTLSGLLKLHAELGGQMSSKAECPKLAADMKHVESVIKMLQPDHDTRRIAVRRRAILGLSG